MHLAAPVRIAGPSQSDHWPLDPVLQLRTATPVSGLCSTPSTPGISRVGCAETRRHYTVAGVVLLADQLEEHCDVPDDISQQLIDDRFVGIQLARSWPGLMTRWRRLAGQMAQHSAFIAADLMGNVHVGERLAGEVAERVLSAQHGQLSYRLRHQEGKAMRIVNNMFC